MKKSIRLPWRLGWLVFLAAISTAAVAFLVLTRTTPTAAENASVVVTPTVIATVAVISGAGELGVNPKTNRVYVAGGNTISVIDGASNTVIGTVPSVFSPAEVGVNPTTNRVYVANQFDNTVTVIDGITNSVLTAVRVGMNPYGLGVNPTTNRIYVATTTDSSVSVIDGNTNTVVANVPVGIYPWGLGVNPKTNRVYVTSGSNTVTVIDGASNTVVATVPVGTHPIFVAVNPTTNITYVANYDDGTVSVIDGTSNTVIATVPVVAPHDIAVNPTTNHVYVTQATDMVSVIDANNVIVATMPVGLFPLGVGVDPITSRVYVANGNSNSVSVIADGPAPVSGLLAPVNSGVRLKVVHGYNDPAYSSTNPVICNIGTPQDHCNNQQFGLDLGPGAGWDHNILAPVGGTPLKVVAGSGDPCLLFRLIGGKILNICNFTTVNTSLLNTLVPAGRVLGTASTTWIHLSIDARPTTCSGGWLNTSGVGLATYPCPVQFAAPYTLEHLALPWDGSTGNQWVGQTFASTNAEIP